MNELAEPAAGEAIVVSSLFKSDVSPDDENECLTPHKPATVGAEVLTISKCDDADHYCKEHTELLQKDDVLDLDACEDTGVGVLGSFDGGIQSAIQNAVVNDSLASSELKRKKKKKKKKSRLSLSHSPNQGGTVFI